MDIPGFSDGRIVLLPLREKNVLFFFRFVPEFTLYISMLAPEAYFCFHNYFSGDMPILHVFRFPGILLLLPAHAKARCMGPFRPYFLSYRVIIPGVGSEMRIDGGHTLVSIASLFPIYFLFVVEV